MGNQNVRQFSDNQKSSSLVVNNFGVSPALVNSKNVSPNIASYGGISPSHSTQQVWLDSGKKENQ